MTTTNKSNKSRMTTEQAMQVLAAAGLDTKEKALAAYGDRIAAKWGEAERAAGIAQKRGLSHGLVANAVVVFDADAIDDRLHAAVQRILTDEDWAWLRKGG